MRIVIAGGHNQADYLISTLSEKKHKLIVINDDKAFCDKLAQAHDIPVYYGDPSKYFVLDEAGIEGYDVLIALTRNDADNLAICQYAKRTFKVRKVLCTVTNPAHVDLFTQFGVDHVISSTHIVAKYITQSTSIESLIKTLSFDDEKVLLTEVAVEDNFACVEKTIADIDFPSNAIIACVIRKTGMIVPTGTTVINAGDKLLLITSPDSQKKAVAAVMR